MVNCDSCSPLKQNKSRQHACFSTALLSESSKRRNRMIIAGNYQLVISCAFVYGFLGCITKRKRRTGASHRLSFPIRSDRLLFLKCIHLVTMAALGKNGQARTVWFLHGNRSFHKPSKPTKQVLQTRLMGRTPSMTLSGAEFFFFGGTILTKVSTDLSGCCIIERGV